MEATRCFVDELLLRQPSVTETTRADTCWTLTITAQIIPNQGQTKICFGGVVLATNTDRILHLFTLFRRHEKLSTADLRRLVPRYSVSGSEAWLRDDTVNACVESSIIFGNLLENEVLSSFFTTLALPFAVGEAIRCLSGAMRILSTKLSVV